MISHPEWSGLVSGILINKSGAQSGIPNCANQTDLPIVQDANSELLWTALSGHQYEAQIYDTDGVLVESIYPAYFASSPQAIDVLVNTVNDLLGQ